MKVKDIMKYIKDEKLFIRVKYTENNGGAVLGEFLKRNLCYNSKIRESKVVSINTQYIDSVRFLVLEVL